MKLKENNDKLSTILIENKILKPQQFSLINICRKRNDISNLKMCYIIHNMVFSSIITFSLYYSLSKCFRQD